MKPAPLLGLFMSLLAPVAGAVAAPEPTAARKAPNVVVIVADDLGWNAVGYHHGFTRTPNIDSIATKGVNLDRFYVSPMCSPTREGILTGRMPPPLKVSSGSMAMALSAEPKRLIRSRKVAGPTFSVRIRRSQESRCRSLSAGAGRLFIPWPRFSIRCRTSAARCWRDA